MSSIVPAHISAGTLRFARPTNSHPLREQREGKQSYIFTSLICTTGCASV